MIEMRIVIPLLVFLVCPACVSVSVEDLDDPGGKDPVSSEPSQIYQPTIADGIRKETMVVRDVGLTGFAGQADGSIIEIRYRLSEDGAVAYLSVNGGAEQGFDVALGGHVGSDYLYGSWGSDEEGYLALSLNNGRAGAVTIHESEFALAGYGGLEAPSEQLGHGTAVYSGSFQTSGGGRLEGPLAMEVDFAEASITGTAIGYSDGGSSIGEVTGELTGSRLAGVFVLEGEAKGELAFVGAVYGDAEQNLAGGVGGTIQLGGEEATLGGSFLVSVPDP